MAMWLQIAQDVESKTLTGEQRLFFRVLERFVKSLLLIDTSSVVEQTPSDENLCETVCDKGLIEAFMEIIHLLNFRPYQIALCDFVNQQIRQYDYASCQIRLATRFKGFSGNVLCGDDWRQIRRLRKPFSGVTEDIVRRKLTPEQQNIVNKFSHRSLASSCER